MQSGRVSKRLPAPSPKQSSLAMVNFVKSLWPNCFTSPTVSCQVWIISRGESLHMMKEKPWGHGAILIINSLSGHKRKLSMSPLKLSTMPLLPLLESALQIMQVSRLFYSELVCISNLLITKWTYYTDFNVASSLCAPCLSLCLPAGACFLFLLKHFQLRDCPFCILWCVGIFSPSAFSLFLHLCNSWCRKFSGMSLNVLSRRQFCFLSLMPEQRRKPQMSCASAHWLSSTFPGSNYHCLSNIPSTVNHFYFYMHCNSVKEALVIHRQHMNCQKNLKLCTDHL